MSTGRRNHYIPRLLLRRFASRVDIKRKKSWIFQYESSGEPKEVSTKDVAVSYDFYGGPKTDLERELNTAETSFTSTLKAIDAGEAPSLHAADLSHFVWLHAIRTRAIRETFSDSAGDIIGSFVGSLNTEDGKAQLHAKIERQLEARVKEELKRMFPRATAAELKFARKKMLAPQNREKLLAEIKSAENTKRTLDVINAVAGALTAGISGAASRGHNKGLTQVLSERSTPEYLSTATWILVECQEDLILGDCCLFARGDGGEIGSVMRHGNSWSELYFPISSRQTLVASKRPPASPLNVTAINEASAACSLDYYYAANNAPHTAKLSALIGTSNAALREGEAEELVRSALTEDRKEA